MLLNRDVFEGAQPELLAPASYVHAASLRRA
jgi:hypothetical protein